MKLIFKLLAGLTISLQSSAAVTQLYCTAQDGTVVSFEFNESRADINETTTAGQISDRLGTVKAANVGGAVEIQVSAYGKIVARIGAGYSQPTLAGVYTKFSGQTAKITCQFVH